MTDEQRSRLREAASSAREAIDVRNAAIIEIHASGVAIRAIATEMGMSSSGVHKIIQSQVQP